MKGFLLLVIAVLLLAFAGWITFERSAERTAVNIETREIRRDSEELLESGERALDRAQQRAAEALNEEEDRP